MIDENVSKQYAEVANQVRKVTAGPPSMLTPFVIAGVASFAGVPHLDNVLLFIAGVAWVEWRKWLWRRDNMDK